jgi:hypothetical protein
MMSGGTPTASACRPDKSARTPGALKAAPHEPRVCVEQRADEERDKERQRQGTLEPEENDLLDGTQEPEH